MGGEGAEEDPARPESSAHGQEVHPPLRWSCSPSRGRQGAVTQCWLLPVTLPGTSPPSLQSHRARKMVLFLLDR